MTHRYSVGVLSWSLSVTEDEIEIGALWGTTRVRFCEITHVGLASSLADRGALAGRLSSGSNFEVNVTNAIAALPQGPAGLALRYKSANGRYRDTSITFLPSDSTSCRLVQQVLDRCADRFVGVGNSASIRASMGLGRGDMLLGLGFAVIICVAIFLLMLLGVVN